MRTKIQSDVKLAMRAGEKDKVQTLRLILAAFQSAEIEAQTQGRPALDAAAEQAVMTRMIKQRRDSATQFEQGARADLVAKELAEIAIIELYLPSQMDETAVRAAVAAAVEKIGATGAKDMGKVMGHLKATYAGVMDFGAASTHLKSLLK